MDHDAVKSPKHYTEGRRFEPKAVIRDWRLNFNLGSALKYIARAGRKGDIVEDLEKAREYLAFEIEAIKAERGRKRATTNPNCKCTTKPIFEEKAAEGRRLGAIVVPDDMPPEVVAQLVKHILEEDLGK